MTLHHALMFLGFTCVFALGCIIGAMVWLSIRLKVHDSRERALPAGRAHLNPALWDGKAALDKARAASDEVHG